MSLFANALALAEGGLNRAVAQDPAVGRRLEGMQGKVLAVTVSGLDQTVYLAPMGPRLQLLPAPPDHPDVKLVGRAGDFLRLAAAKGQDKMDALKDTAITIEGDAMLAQQFATLFDELDLDLEAPLERWFGTAAAGRIGQGLRSLLGWGRQTAGTLGLDAVEYLREETGDLVHGEDIEAWSAEVDALDKAVDTLDARLKRLERKHAP